MSLHGLVPALRPTASLKPSFSPQVRSARVTLGIAILAFCLMPTGTASAVNVTNYSWLQLPPADVTTVLGSADNVTGTAFGDPDDFRWGDYVWLPSFPMTNSGTQMYYAAVRLDEPRPISTVRVQLWQDATMGATQYFIDASNDGSSWTNIGVQGSPVVSTGSAGNMQSNAVTPGTYQYVRVRLEGPDYASSGYGGPGLLMIEPVGTGAVSGDQVNWANSAFGTTIVNTNMPTYNNTTYNDGTLENRTSGNWTGTSGNWGTTSAYTTINLDANRLINSATVAWMAPYGGNDFDVEYSLDGSSYFPVGSPAAPVNYATYYTVGATQVTFDPTIARYIRITNASGAFSGFTLMEQLLLHGPTDGALDSDPNAGELIDVLFNYLPQTVNVTNAVQIENIGGPGTYVGVLSYQITGPDAAQFSLTNFVPTILASGDDVFFDLAFSTLLGTEYNAVLTFQTNLGDLVFDLHASMVPEPSTMAALPLVAGMLFHVRRRRRS
jgi:hypothetical protein